ncbi:AAA family ATPase [Psychrilyobacter atlanticus]|uniref:AAA family ATPase n=1 Tax=Psychrilyobacter atlanticus TaxID=271091 RepID=UPI000409DBC0|nr:AAA family ATPase [Psychrilyobacter atlanticus]
MEEKEKIIGNIKYLIEKSEYFTRLKDEESFLFEELKKIKKSDLVEVMKYYKGGEKVKKIRYLAAKSILENELTQEKLETIKIEVNSEYKKNILHAWKNFGLLYVLFFNPIKEKVKNHLKEISSFISPNLELKFKIKNIDFDGSQNQGRCSCWIAFYNAKYKSQSEGYQYALDLNIKDLHYGVYHHKTKENFFEETFNKEEINEELLEKIIKNLKEYSSIILEEGKKGSVNKNKVPLNQILYGPPGTGKTYNTVNKALEIIDNQFYLENQNNREILKEKFEEYKENGQIEFITFHQSYGYEEFIEGIKAIPSGKEGNETNEMIYDVVDGVFKLIIKECISKNEVETNDILINENTTIWKMSLGNSQNGEDKYYYEEALNTDTIIMGYGNNVNFSNCNSKKDIEKLSDDQTTIDMIDRFKHQIKIDDIVIISDGNRKFKAIVQVISDYYFDGKSNFNQKRKIKWLQRFSNSKDALKVSDRYFTQVTLNKPQGINKDNLINYLSNKDMVDNRDKNYVLIIDEVNRGNISKIFGELITLIEGSKRLGGKEELEITLPYSGDKFGVPNNLYILGTMNTADRSIALMDTALRRRFNFEEMMPNPCLLYDKNEVYGIEDENEEVNILELNNWNFEDKEHELYFDEDYDHDLFIGQINLRRLLYKINQRIEYLYDRDHMIGHAYFIGVKTKEELDDVMKNKIIPLLQEYFYDDWEKIQIVLGDHKEQNKNIGENERFIIANKMNEVDILGFDHDDIEDESISYIINSEFIENTYIKIYKKLEKTIKGKKDE